MQFAETQPTSDNSDTLALVCILKKYKVKVKQNSSVNNISQSEIAGSSAYQLRPGYSLAEKRKPDMEVIV